MNDNSYLVIAAAQACLVLIQSIHSIVLMAEAEPGHNAVHIPKKRNLRFFVKYVRLFNVVLLRETMFVRESTCNPLTYE